MRRLHHLLLVLIVASAVVPVASAGAASPLGPPAGRPAVSATEIILKPASAGASFALQTRLRRDGARVIERSYDGEALLVEVPSGRGSREYARAVADAVDLEVAEPLGYVTASEVPTDPSYHSQWGLAAIGAPAAWDRGWGSSAVVIAVVDSGVDLNHPDLVDQIASGGWDFVDGDTVPDDLYGHGTHVAGIAAAEANNGLFGSGTAPGCRILPVRVLGADGVGNTWGTAQGIEWAVNNGADVVNLSLGTPEQNDYLSDAVAYAIANGVVVVAASGNVDASHPRLTDVQYPAREPGVIAVGAIQNTTPYSIAAFSQDGASLDLMGPGVNIYSTLIDRADYMSGTSMATPFVAGTVALMKSLDPRLTPAEIASTLAATAADLGAPGRDDTYGYGLARADAAAEAAYAASLVPRTVLDVDQVASPTGWYRVAPQITLTPDMPSVTYYRWDDGAVQVYAGPFHATEEGIRTLTYWSDAGTFAESPRTMDFRVDTQAPTGAVVTFAVARGTVSADIAWTAGTDTGSGVAGYVVRTVPNASVLAATTSTSAVVAGLSPGSSYALEVVTSDVAGNIAVSAPVVVSTVSASALQPVYRFYNPGSGTHFFTPSAEERDMVMATWSQLYT
ncbi:MAG: S8 family serine peptidase, partial [Coriobacteriia bacterium]